MFMFSSIMVRHQAMYDVDSKMGEGTTFTLEFPLDRREKAREEMNFEEEDTAKVA